jgi:hypothetical protein
MIRIHRQRPRPIRRLPLIDSRQLSFHRSMMIHRPMTRGLPIYCRKLLDTRFCVTNFVFDSDEREASSCIELKWATISNQAESHIAVTPIQGIEIDWKSGLTSKGLVKFASKKALKYLKKLFSHHDDAASSNCT